MYNNKYWDMMDIIDVIDRKERQHEDKLNTMSEKEFEAYLKSLHNKKLQRKAG